MQKTPRKNLRGRPAPELALQDLFPGVANGYSPAAPPLPILHSAFIVLRSALKTPSALNCFSRSFSDSRSVVGRPCGQLLARSISSRRASSASTSAGVSGSPALDGCLAAHHIEDLVQQFFPVQVEPVPVRRVRATRGRIHRDPVFRGTRETTEQPRCQARTGRLRCPAFPAFPVIGSSSAICRLFAGTMCGISIR